MTDKTDIYTRITDQIIAALEQGAESWRMPWHIHAGLTDYPTNISSKKPYRGVNVLSLWAESCCSGYPTGIWGTYKQWAEIGAQVRKGEVATHIVFWKAFSKDAEADSDDKDTKKRGGLMAKSYCVFNAAQVDGYTPELPIDQPEKPANERLDEIEAFFSRIGADVRHGGNRAFYRSSLADDSGYIQMPEFTAFPVVLDYYSTLAHEFIHWTGNKNRLARDLKNRFGSEAYAAEELIAELGSAFLCGSLGISNEPRPDHASYIANWLKILRDDKKAIFTAASKAQQAADWLHERSAGKEEKLAA